MNTTDKIRWLAEQAGWRDTKLVRGRTLWEHSGLGRSFELPDYPNSLDAIARDLLPILREKDMQYNLHWNGHDHGFIVWDSGGAEIGSVQYPAEPAAAAMEAIFEALHGVAA